MSSPLDTPQAPSDSVALPLEATATAAPRKPALALQDLIILAYMCIVAVLLFLRAPPSGPSPVLRPIGVTIVVLLASAFAARGLPKIPRFLRIGVYRVVLVGGIVFGYLMLRDVLPAIRSDSVDSSLAAVDQRIFGGQPVLWLEALNRAPIVEWLSFFYWNYYTINLAFVIGVLWFVKPGRVTTEYCIGTALLYCLGHLGYMCVPAYGPVQFFAERFHEPLHGSTFLNLVLSSVAGGGAQKDVFPSLHTGGSVWLALFAVHQWRLDKRWRWPAIATVFATVNIVVSTLVLRWHYAIDVIAGLVLSSGVAVAAARLAAWEEARRERLNQVPVWHFD